MQYTDGDIIETFKSIFHIFQFGFNWELLYIKLCLFIKITVLQVICNRKSLKYL